MRREWHSEGYNMVFDTKTGFMARWGKTMEEDPVMAPHGPELADIEISTVCHGVGASMEKRRPCTFCYKSNTGEGENMSLGTFMKVFANLNAEKTLTQIAFGIGDIDANKDLWAIMAWAKIHNVVPNITINGMITEDHARRLAKLCGAVAVSHYGDDLCFNAIDMLYKAGLRQINIHKLLSKQTYRGCFDLIDKVKADPRAAPLKAIVFLLLKPKGERNSFDSIVSMEEYKRVMDYAKEKGVDIGMDSCSAPMALKTLPGEVIQSVEPCESTLFSIYVNTLGELFPCSFTEGTPGWEKGVDLTTERLPFWFHPRVVAWREGLVGSSAKCECSMKSHCRSCPIYDITICQPKPHLQGNETEPVRLTKLGRRSA